jgi:FixJ family two-component response regulator
MPGVTSTVFVVDDDVSVRESLELHVERMPGWAVLELRIVSENIDGKEAASAGPSRHPTG